MSCVYLLLLFMILSLISVYGTGFGARALSMDCVRPLRTAALCIFLAAGASCSVRTAQVHAVMQAPKPRTLLTSEDTRRSTPQASLRAVLSTPLYALTSFNRIPRAAPLYAASAKSCLPTTCCATPFFHVRPVLLKHTLVPPKRLIVQLAL